MTAQKREQLIQDVPVSITAFDAEQLDALKVRDLTRSVEYACQTCPWTTLVRRAALRTSPFVVWVSTARFRVSTRRSASSSMACIWARMRRCCTTPSTWTAVEVLRGPQGVLFGRNVVGGAVLLNTKTPTDRYEATLRSCGGRRRQGPEYVRLGDPQRPADRHPACPLHSLFQSGSGLV